LFVSYTPFPPFTSIFFIPWTILPIELSKVMFNCISSLLFFVTIVRITKYYAISPVCILLLPIIFFTPIRSNIYFGQSYLLLFCLLIEGYMAYEKKQIFLSSILWGIAILFKVFPVLIFLFLLLQKKYKHIVYLTSVCLVLLIVSILINGFYSWKFYLTQIFPRLNNGELNDSYTYIFQSGFMLLKNVFIYDELQNPNVIFNNIYIFSILLALFKALIISSCVFVTINKQNMDSLLSFAIWITASMIISPNGSTYSLVLLIIPVVAILRSSYSLISKCLICLLVTLICNIPVTYVESLSLLLKFPRLYLMIVFFVFTVILAKVQFNYKIFSVLLFLFMLIESHRLYTKTDQSTSLLTQKKYDLIYNYYSRNDSMICCYWTTKGSKEEYIASIISLNTKDLFLKDNQIYYKGSKITNSADWKRKPILLNGEYIVYLSDKNRGVGFYTLRKINLNHHI